MHIRVSPRGGGGLHVRLRRPSDCAGIDIESTVSDPTGTRTALLASGAAVAVDGDEFLISTAWLRSQAGVLPEDPGWIHAFDTLIASLQSDDSYLADIDAIRVVVSWPGVDFATARRPELGQPPDAPRP